MPIALQPPFQIMISSGCFRLRELSEHGRQPADSEELNRARNYIHCDREGEQLVARSRPVPCILGAYNQCMPTTSWPGPRLPSNPRFGGRHYCSAATFRPFSAPFCPAPVHYPLGVNRREQNKLLGSSPCGVTGLCKGKITVTHHVCQGTADKQCAL